MKNNGTTATQERGTKMSNTNFQAGATYGFRFINDSSTVHEITIIRRTTKSVWIADPHDATATVRRGIRVHNGVERIDPHGRYSMAPVLSADREVA